MDILSTLVLAVFVTLLIVASITFGFVLLAVFMGIAIVAAALIMIRRLWWRWRFTHSPTNKPKDPNVIDVEYQDITDQNKEG